MKALAARKQLQALNLNGCSNITDAALKAMAECKQLHLLDLTDCKHVTDKGLKELAACKDLKRVSVRYCGVSKNGVADLQKALPKAEVIR